MLKISELFQNTTLRSEDEYRELCKTLCNAYPDVPQAKNIVVFCSNPPVFLGKDADSQRMTKTMLNMMHGGFLIRPDYKIKIVDPDEVDEYIKKFKAGEIEKGDAFIVSHINSHYYSMIRAWHMASNEANQHKDNAKAEKIFKDLMHENIHADRDKWQNFVRESQPFWIATIGGFESISSRTFCPEDPDLQYLPYSPLKQSPCAEKKSFAAEPGNGDIEPMNADHKMSNFTGICIQDEYLKQTSQSINPDHELGKTASYILDLKTPPDFLTRHSRFGI